MKYWNNKTQALALCGLAFLVYGFGVGRAFDFDDIVYISANPILRRADALHAFWFTSEAFNYYPLFWSLLRLQWLLWGDQPLGYHLVNLVMHSANCLLLWRLGREWRWPGAWWVAALFAVHPINVQTVAWAAEQKNTWSFFFMGLALLAFLQQSRTGSWRGYLLALTCFAAALACKTSTVCLPVFLTIYYVFNREGLARRMLPRLAPFYLLALAAGVTTVWFEQHRAAAKSLLGTLNLWTRLEVAGATFWFYLGKALLPVGLTPMYRGWVDTTAATHTALPGLLLLMLLAVCALGWRRLSAPVALGLTYYALMLLPLLGVFDTNYFAYSLVADHWQYHALPGVIVAGVAAAAMLKQQFPRLAPCSLPVALITVLGATALAATHFAHFEDPRSLWTYVVAKNPEAWIGWYNLGNVRAADREYGPAIAAFRNSLRTKPDYYQTHFNLGNALSGAGRVEEAEQAYRAAEALQDDDPDLRNNRGVALLRLSQNDAAMAEFARALELEPGQVSARVNLIVLLLRQGRIAEAAEHLEQAGRLSAGNAHRIAEAITAHSPNTSNERPALESFARRACALSANQPELLAAWRVLHHPPENAPRGLDPALQPP